MCVKPQKQQFTNVYRLQSADKDQVLLECRKIIEQNSRYATIAAASWRKSMEQNKAQEAKQILDEGLPFVNRLGYVCFRSGHATAEAITV